MAKLIALVVLLASSAWANGNLCLGPTSGSATLTGASWTNCGGTYPGDGDWIVWRSTGTFTLNADLGTVMGGGVKWIRIEYGTFTSDKVATHTIVFGSTGTDPIGSGTQYNPGADANMQGFFIAQGAELDLEGVSATNAVVVTTANGTSPWYVHHARGDFRGCTAFTANVCNGAANYAGIGHITLKWIDSQAPIGANVTGFKGIDHSVYQSNVTVQNTRFAGYYELLHCCYTTGTSTAITWKNNTSTGAQSMYALNLATDPGTTAILDNTDSSPTVAGYYVRTLYKPSNPDIERNAVLGTAGVRRGLLLVGGNNSGTGGLTVKHNYCQNTAGSTGNHNCVQLVVPANDTTTVVVGNVAENSYQSYGVTATDATATPLLQDNWGIESSDTALGQGVLFTYSGSPTWKGNVAILNSTNGNILAMAYRNISTPIFDHNTLVGVGTTGNTSFGLVLGELGTSTNIVNAKARSNLISDIQQVCVVDGHASNTYAVDVSPAVGVHHNATFNCGLVNYTNPPLSSSGFDDQIHRHPDNARYGDIDGQNPRYLDVTRRPAGWNALMGGPGTVADTFTQLAKRSGWGGAYSWPVNPIAEMNLWLRQGWMPTNLAFKRAGHDQADIGAVTITQFNRPGGVF